MTKLLLRRSRSFPGYSAHGKTPDEALTNCKDAMELWIHTAAEFDRPIPEPKGRRLQYA
jgi:predicted RNase H-like HicB family nuclease